MNALGMIAKCFEHQHPEEFKSAAAEIHPYFGPETSQSHEPTPWYIPRYVSEASLEELVTPYGGTEEAINVADHENLYRAV
jgi:hypothetical protein